MIPLSLFEEELLKDCWGLTCKPEAWMWGDKRNEEMWESPCLKLSDCKDWPLSNPKLLLTSFSRIPKLKVSLRIPLSKKLGFWSSLRSWSKSISSCLVLTYSSILSGGSSCIITLLMKSFCDRKDEPHWPSTVRAHSLTLCMIPSELT